MIREGNLLLLLFLKDWFVEELWNCFLDWSIKISKGISCYQILMGLRFDVWAIHDIETKVIPQEKNQSRESNGQNFKCLWAFRLLWAADKHEFVLETWCQMLNIWPFICLDHTIVLYSIFIEGSGQKSDVSQKKQITRKSTGKDFVMLHPLLHLILPDKYCKILQVGSFFSYH